jgi:hypothetical protein
MSDEIDFYADPVADGKPTFSLVVAGVIVALIAGILFKLAHGDTFSALTDIPFVVVLYFYERYRIQMWLKGYYRGFKTSLDQVSTQLENND